LADEVRIAAYPNKIGIAVPTRDYVYVHMVRQSRTGASAEIHPDIEAVGLYCKSQHFLDVPHQFCHFEKLFVVCLFEIGYVPNRCDEQMAIVIGEAIKHRDTVFGAPQDKIFAVVLRGFNVSADKALTFIGKPLDISDSPRRP
jgi:hypothetical protein